MSQVNTLKYSSVLKASKLQRQSSAPSLKLRESLKDQIKRMEKNIFQQIDQDSATISQEQGASSLGPSASEDLLLLGQSDEKRTKSSRRRKRRKKQKKSSSKTIVSSEEMSQPSVEDDVPSDRPKSSLRVQTFANKNQASVANASKPPPPNPSHIWTRHYDHNFQHHYFYNHRTGDTTWSEPPGWIDESGMTPEILFASLEQSKPDGSVEWIQFRDPYGFYYRNPLTGDVTTQRPKLWRPYQNLKSTATPTYNKINVTATPDSILSQLGHHRVTSKHVQSPLLTEDVSRDSLRNGHVPLWIRHRDPRHGHYFENTKTKEITWNEPKSPYMWALSHSQSQSLSRPTSPQGQTATVSLDANTIV